MASTVSAPKRAHKRTFSKKELLNHLKILGPITNPLPATLPPSPPPSRSASPALEKSSSTTKRKRDDSEVSSSPSSSVAKRSRPSPDVGAIPPQAPPTPPSDDSDSSSRRIPVKRPRRGRQERTEYAILQQKYTKEGRQFKHSAEARMGVYLRHDAPAFVQLLNTPPADSPYAKMDRVMSKLESLDGVICFAYSQWHLEYFARRFELHWWQNATSYFDMAKATFSEGFTDPGPREEALMSIHNLIDAYWRSRHAWHLFRYSVEPGMKEAVAGSRKSPLNHKTPPATNTNTHARSPSVNPTGNGATLQPTPPNTGLSPAANHTTTNGSAGASQSPVVLPGHGTIPLSERLAKDTQTATELFVRSGESFFQASQRLTLPILEAHFPHTYARVSKSTLKNFEEWEIDFEDDESELFWPLAPGRGEGLGWVLALGRSMLREYGKPLGYKGIEGTIRSEDIVRPNRR